MQLGKWDKGFRFKGMLPKAWFLLGPLVGLIMMFVGISERRAPEVAELIRQAFLQGISTRQVGRVVATLTGEAVSAQTVSKLPRVLDRGVAAFHQRRLPDDCAYLVLDGV